MSPGLLLALALAAADAGEAPTTSAPDAAVSATRPSLLRAAKVMRADGCPNVARIADGVASVDTDVWDSPRAAVLAATGVVEWDLGAVEPIAAVRIQADNNDRYTLTGSVDGVTWYGVWVAQAVELPGLQTRTSPELSLQARFLRLTAAGGDNLYSISELEVFDSTAALVGAQLERVAPPPPPPPPPAPPFDTGFLVVFGVAVLIASYFFWAKHHNKPKPPPPAEPPAAS